MFRVRGLYGHIQQNNLKTVALILGFLMLFVGGTVTTLQLTLHAAQFARGERNEALLKRVLDPDQSGFSYGRNRLPRPAAPKTGPEDKDAPLDVSRAPIYQQPLLSLLFASPAIQGLLALAVALAYLTIAVWWHSQRGRFSFMAREIVRREHPDLYILIENLAMSIGAPCPGVEIIDSPKLNAFATGLTLSSARIGLTSGLIQRLAPRELEAVVAQQFVHVLNRDSRVMAVTQACLDLVVTQPIAYVRKMRNQGFLALLPLGVAIWVGALDVKFYLGLLAVMAACVVFAFLCETLILRTREIVADAGALDLVKTPEPLISALRKISADPYIPEGGPYAEAMMIHGDGGGLFGTHRSIDDRLTMLRRHGGSTSASEVYYEVVEAAPANFGAGPRFGSNLNTFSDSAPTFGKRRISER